MTDDRVQWQRLDQVDPFPFRDNVNLAEREFTAFYLYPCPWYKINELRAQANDYADDGRWPFVEDIGRKLRRSN